MFRDPVLNRPGPSDEEDRTSRDRMPGEPQAYHRPQSPAQTPFSCSPTNRPPPSNPPTPAPLPLQHHSHFNNTRSTTSTANTTTELPPISTAFFSRESTTTSRYYDPTSDHGDTAVGRNTTRYNDRLPSQVCQSILLSSSLMFCRPGTFADTTSFTGTRIIHLYRYETG